MILPITLFFYLCLRVRSFFGLFIVFNNLSSTLMILYLSLKCFPLRLPQSMDSDERNLLVPRYEGIPSPSTEYFCWLKEEPLAKMEERRKPKVLFMGVPRNFLAPAAFRVARSLNLSINSE